MGDAANVKSLYCRAKCLSVGSRFLFAEFAFFLELVVKWTSWKILKQEIDILFLVKNRIDGNYVWVGDWSLELDFKGELVNHHMLLYYCFRDFLESKNAACLLVNYHENASKSTFSQLFPKHKITNTHFLFQEETFDGRMSLKRGFDWLGLKRAPECLRFKRVSYFRYGNRLRYIVYMFFRFFQTTCRCRFLPKLDRS